jgi:hypothetical protein
VDDNKLVIFDLSKKYFALSEEKFCVVDYCIAGNSVFILDSTNAKRLYKSINSINDSIIYFNILDTVKNNRIYLSPDEDNIIIEEISDSLIYKYHILSVMGNKKCALPAIQGYRFIMWQSQEEIIIEKEGYLYSFNIKTNQTICLYHYFPERIGVPGIVLTNLKKFLYAENKEDVCRLYIQKEKYKDKIIYTTKHIIMNILSINNKKILLLERAYTIDKKNMCYYLTEIDEDGNIIEQVNICSLAGVNPVFQVINISGNVINNKIIIYIWDALGKSRIYEWDLNNLHSYKIVSNDSRITAEMIRLK